MVPAHRGQTASRRLRRIEAARNDHQLDASPRQRQVTDPTMIPTCTRREAVPQDGHAADSFDARTVIVVLWRQNRCVPMKNGGND
jgi:hypothetical protein